jgi:hypothetical protein
MAQFGIEAAPLRCGRLARLGRQCKGWNSEWAIAAEKKYDDECKNIGMFKRPNQNSVKADKESSEHQCPRGSPSPLSMFCHGV